MASFESGALFEREGRTDGGGSGFGMWIARNILELHGATTNVITRADDDMVEYIIDFPLEVLNFAHENIQEDEMLSRKQSSLLPVPIMPMPTALTPFIPLSILIVDDSAMVRRVTSRLVKELGHTFAEAVDGEKAVQAVASGAHYDVILMDNQMPVMTGVEATKVIREKHGFKGIILAVTGNALEEDIREFEEAGANKVILKPLTKDAFENGTLHE
jgi:CheY-like chemotaxis protein